MHCFSILKLALYVRLQERPILCSEHNTVHYNVHNTVHKTVHDTCIILCIIMCIILCIILAVNIILSVAVNNLFGAGVCVLIWSGKQGIHFCILYLLLLYFLFCWILYFVFVLFCVDLKWKEMHSFLRNNVMEIKCNHIAQWCIHWNKYYCNNGTQYNRLI